MKTRIVLTVAGLVVVAACVVLFFAADEIYRLGVDLWVPLPVGW